MNLSELMDQFVYKLGRRYPPLDLGGTGGGVFAAHRGHGLATYHGVTGGCQEFRCECGDVIFVRLEPGRVALRRPAGPPVRCTCGYQASDRADFGEHVAASMPHGPASHFESRS